MKVEVNKTEKKFEPIELKIFIETRKEYRIIKAITELNVTLPKAVADWDKSINEGDVRFFLSNILDKLTNN